MSRALLEGMTSKRSKGSLPLSSGSLTSFLELIPLDIDIEKTRQICIKEKQLKVIPSNIGMLLREVRRIDFSSNDIRDVSPLATLTCLSYINLSKNPMLESIAPLSSMQLNVCLLAHCNIRSLRGLEGSASTLKSLVLNDNNVILQSPTGAVSVSGKVEDVSLAIENYKILEALQACETVIFSRNRLLCSLYDAPSATESPADEKKKKDTEPCNKTLTELPHHEADWANPLSVFEKMPHLKKLSLSECGLTTLPSHWFLPKATELRFSKNALQTLVPEGVIFRSVKILDVSHNSFSAVSTLRRCRFVRQLSISGNPFLTEYDNDVKSEDSTQKFSPRLIHFLTRMMPHLEVVDSIPLSSLKQKENSGTLVTIEETDEGGMDCRHNDASKEDSGEYVHDIQSGLQMKAKKKRPREECSPNDAEKDVVVDPPQDVMDATHTPSIVRRERTNLLDKRKNRLAADGALVAQLINKRKTEKAACIKRMEVRLKSASREELIQHILTQRLLIRKLHRRIVDLEQNKPTCPSSAQRSHTYIPSAPPPSTSLDGLREINRLLQAHAAGKTYLSPDTHAELLYIQHELSGALESSGHSVGGVELREVQMPTPTTTTPSKTKTTPRQEWSVKEPLTPTQLSHRSSPPLSLVRSTQRRMRYADE